MWMQHGVFSTAAVLSKSQPTRFQYEEPKQLKLTLF